MENLTLPLAPEIAVKINGQTVGALQSFREVTNRSLHPIRQLGSEEILGFYTENTGYTVTLGVMMTAGLSAFDVHGLSAFTLTVCFADRTVTFGGCEYASLETVCSVGGSLLCRAELHALTRSSSEAG